MNQSESLEQFHIRVGKSIGGTTGGLTRFAVIGGSVEVTKGRS